ncbi:MAG: hypothetical protein QOI22_805 [Verrucomicrobiota bacterium]
MALEIDILSIGLSKIRGAASRVRIGNWRGIRKLSGFVRIRGQDRQLLFEHLGRSRKASRFFCALKARQTDSTSAGQDRKEPAAYQLVGEVTAHQGIDG